MKKILIPIVLCFSTHVFATNKTFIIKFNKQSIDLPKPIDCSNTSNLMLISQKTFSYNGLNGYDGTVQISNVPKNAHCASFAVAGGGGGGILNSASPGGNGGLVNGNFSINGITEFQLVIAGIAQRAGGGGLSGVFLGQPSKPNALIVAGGGGGSGGDGVNVNTGIGGDGGFSLTYTPTITTSNLPGDGYGGSGDKTGTLPIPFSTGGIYNFPDPSTNSIRPESGAYGGGGYDDDGNAGGAGIPGGKAGFYDPNLGYFYGGGGGTSYCSNQVLNCSGITGGGAKGGNSNDIQGKSGYIIVKYYQ